MRKWIGMVLTLALLLGIAVPTLAYTYIWPEFRGNNFRIGPATRAQTAIFLWRLMQQA